MELENGFYVDGKFKGNLSRFINHRLGYFNCYRTLITMQTVVTQIVSYSVGM